MRPARHDHGHHLVAYRQVGVGPFADLVEHTGHVHARHIGRRAGLGLHLGSGTSPHMGVGGTDRGGPHPDPHLAGTGLWRRQLHHLQCLRPAVLHDSYCSHGRRG